ncbi:hypothetical protein CVT25_014230 [Psilocybe cyanescens]|uniref:Uncharacterized protein n=1 Tax=Psilocybe cyanescens TaxID=93625 RepID=A0A409XJQ5_PSICY|nr:hypothetical protein CVT25_014230 [Psilocybe cyanescens]
MDFLKKYDRSSLSSLELDALTDWLSVLMHMARGSRRIIQGANEYHAREDYTTDDGEPLSTMADFDQDGEL